MRLFLVVLQIIVMLSMVGIILLQRGEDAATSFTSSKKGTSGLVKATGFLAFVFFVNCIFLARLINKESSVVESAPPLPTGKDIPNTTEEKKKEDRND